MILNAIDFKNISYYNKNITRKGGILLQDIKIFAFADEAATDIEGQIKALKRNGLDGLEIRGVDGQNISDISIKKAREVKQMLDFEGLCVWSIGSPIGKVDITSPAQDELDRFKRVLETANICGAGNIRMFSFYKTDSSAACFDEICRRLDDMIAAAKGSGVDLCHENEKGIFGDTAERCYKLHAALPAFRGVFDPANFVQCGCDTLKAWEMLAPYINYMHMKDACESKLVVPAGKGSGKRAHPR